MASPFRDLPPQDVVTYSEPHLHTGSLVKFSPCGSYIASAASYRLIVRDVDTLQIVQLYSCTDEIEGLEWSCDSEYVLCSIQKRGAAQVWSVTNNEWHCKIDEGPVGLAHARWSPDGRHVLATADFRLRITIWSLCDRSVFYIRFPKHVGKGLDFTADGSMMALAERSSSKDSVGLFNPKGWQPIRQFAVASVDLEDLKWSPNSQVLCVIDGVLQYQVRPAAAAAAAAAIAARHQQLRCPAAAATAVAADHRHGSGRHHASRAPQRQATTAAAGRSGP